MTQLPCRLRSFLYIPRRRRVDRQDRLAGLLHRRDAGVEGRFDGQSDAEAEDGVDDEVGARQAGLEVGCEGNGEILELRHKAFEEVGRAGLRVEDCGCVAVVVEMTGADKAVATWSDEVRKE